MGRHEHLGKVLQETVDGCVEKVGFRKDGINTSPMLNTTYASMDWDARVIDRFLEEADGSYNYYVHWYIGHYSLLMQSVKSSMMDIKCLRTRAWKEKN
jgi:hypothetical protein